MEDSPREVSDAKVKRKLDKAYDVTQKQRQMVTDTWQDMTQAEIRRKLVQTYGVNFRELTQPQRQRLTAAWNYVMQQSEQLGKFKEKMCFAVRCGAPARAMPVVLTYPQRYEFYFDQSALKDDFPMSVLVYVMFHTLLHFRLHLYYRNQSSEFNHAQFQNILRTWTGYTQASQYLKEHGLWLQMDDRGEPRRQRTKAAKVVEALGLAHQMLENRTARGTYASVHSTVLRLNQLGYSKFRIGAYDLQLCSIPLADWAWFVGYQVTKTTKGVSNLLGYVNDADIIDGKLVLRMTDSQLRLEVGK